MSIFWLAAGTVVEKNVPTERGKIRAAAPAKLVWQVLFVCRPVEVMGVGIDDGEIVLNYLFS
ncbi:MAG TPA: hypothetical protein VHK27_12555 [Gammaproteobacteria bacterium]|nr:hypothetical protein [Gammaproteobacteria bacterium]